MLFNNKKAISEVVSYVLLVIIAVGVAALVYNYVQSYVPKESNHCEESINVMVKDYTCEGGRLSLVLTNKGLFKVDAAAIRVDLPGKKVKTYWLNDPKNTAQSADWFDFLNSSHQSLTSLQGLNPGDVYNIPPGNSFSLDSKLSPSTPSPDDYQLELEVQAVMRENDRLIFCDNAVVSQTITCSPNASP